MPAVVMTVAVALLIRPSLGDLARTQFRTARVIGGMRVLVEFCRRQRRGVIGGRQPHFIRLLRGTLRARDYSGEQQRHERSREDGEFSESKAGCPHRLSF